MRRIVFARPRFGAGFLGNGLNGSPKTEDAEHGAGGDEEDIGEKGTSAGTRAEPRALAHPKPKDTGETIREPRNEKRRKNTEQRVEDGNGLGNDESNSPHGKRHTGPADNRHKSATDKMLAVLKHAVEDVLARHVSVNNACDDNSGNSDTPNGLAHSFRASGRESRRGDGRANVVVDDDSSNEVQGGVDNLEKGKGFGPILRLLELANNAKEARVARKGDGDVSNSQESRCEAKLPAHFDNGTADGLAGGDVADCHERGDYD